MLLHIEMHEYILVWRSYWSAAILRYGVRLEHRYHSSSMVLTHRPPTAGESTILWHRSPWVERKSTWAHSSNTESNLVIAEPFCHLWPLNVSSVRRATDGL